MKAAIYTRVSTEEQGAEGVSLANQLCKCRLQAQLSDLEAVFEVQDCGRSAKNLNRPGIQEILSLIKAKQVQAIIIFKLDRLTRNVSDLNRLIELFTKAGVSLISVKDSLDTTTAAGRMVINILGSISQWEREAIGERTSEALQYKKTQNLRYTRITPYGYSLDGEKYKEEESEQRIIMRIVHLRKKEGITYQRIADLLNQEAVPTRQGKLWVKQTIHRIVLESVR